MRTQRAACPVPTLRLSVCVRAWDPPQGGSTAELTVQIARNAQKYLGQVSTDPTTSSHTRAWSVCLSKSPRTPNAPLPTDWRHRRC
jgi:hypothetical protein